MYYIDTYIIINGILFILTEAVPSDGAVFGYNAVRSPAPHSIML